jgi:hypothetical protein
MMVTILFVAFVVIFVVTAVVTLLGITKKIDIDERYLRPLFVALILEVGGAVVALFGTIDLGVHTASAFIETLPEEVRAEDQSEARLNIKNVLDDVDELKAELEKKDKTIGELEERLEPFEDIGNSVLLQFARLNLDIATSEGHFINLQFEPEKKGEVAARVHAAGRAIGAFTADTGPGVEAVREALIAYQTRKQFPNATGNFGRHTLNTMIADYLENVRQEI